MRISSGGRREDGSRCGTAEEENQLKEYADSNLPAPRWFRRACLEADGAPSPYGACSHRLANRDKGRVVTDSGAQRSS